MPAKCVRNADSRLQLNVRLQHESDIPGITVNDRVAAL